MQSDNHVRNEPVRRLAPWQVRRAIQLLVASISTDCSVAALAHACGLSRGHFAHAFRTTMGVPPHKWLLLQRIGRARELMEQTDRTLAEIALSCGFADQSHFTRTFRSLVGTSPAVWRRERRSGVTAIELALATANPYRVPAAIGPQG